MINDFKLIDISGNVLGTLEDEPATLSLLKSKKAEQKIRNIYSKLPYSFNFYFLNYDRWTKNHPVFHYSRITNNKDEIINDFPVFDDYLKDDQEVINVIYTTNLTSYRNYIPFTAWILAHRMIHVYHFGGSKNNNRISQILNESSYEMRRVFSYISRNFYKIDQCLYSYKKDLKSYGPSILSGLERETIELLNRIFTMRSARMGKLTLDLDILPELFAQYIITGKITFNKAPIEFNNRIIGYDTQATATAQLDELARELEKKFKNILILSKGSFYVL